MDQRKLIKLGNSSFAIALPKEWVDRAGLKKGDNVFLEENAHGEIIVQPTLKKVENEKEKVIKLEQMSDEEIGRIMVSSYVSGSKLIRFIGDKNSLKTVKSDAKTFLNLEPVEENEREILLKDMLDIKDVGICNFLRRMDNNLKEMFLLLSEILNDEKSQNKKKKIEEISEIDKDVTKFYFLIWRFMNLGVDNPAVQANLKISPSLLINHFWIAYNMEQIGDELKRIARQADKVQDKTQLIEIFNILNKNYNDSMKSFFDKDKSLAHNIISTNNSLTESIGKLSDVQSLEIIGEKFQQINASIHRNAKMMFYNL
jgi:phosphate uptake regulator